MSVRARKQTPWYHQPLPQCGAETKHSGDQCINSARYTNGHGLDLCKVHRDMAIQVGMKGLRLIRQNMIDLRAVHQDAARVIPFRSAGAS
jgi:hypothetical protein